MAMKCQWCGNDFDPARSDAVFCSTKCRVASHRANKPKNAQLKLCDYCGSVIPMTQPGQPHRYCSNAHRQAAYRKRNPEARLLRLLPRMFPGDLQGAFNYCQIQHAEKYGYDWKWKGAAVVRRGGAYYLEPGPDSFKMFDGTYLGRTFDRAITSFVDYVRNGKENAAARRAR